jgi:hypothetical protein
MSPKKASVDHAKLEQTQVIDLRDTISFLNKDRGKLLNVVNLQKGELDRQRSRLTANDGLRSTMAKDHLNTLNALRVERDAVDRRNLVIVLLSIPYVIAIARFIVAHLTVIVH